MSLPKVRLPNLGKLSLPSGERLASWALVMLALAASHGVYQFAELFAGHWFALVTAGAFELSYVALARLDNLPATQQERAKHVALGAAVASVGYNLLSGWFHLLGGMPSLAEPWQQGLWLLFLATLHAVPLTMVGYNLAILIHHGNTSKLVTEEQEVDEPPASTSKPANLQLVKTAKPAKPASVSLQVGDKSLAIDSKLASRVGELRKAGLSWQKVGERLAGEGYEVPSRETLRQRYGAHEEAA